MASYLTVLTFFLSNQHVVDDHTINWTRLSFYYTFIWLQCLFYQTLGQLLGILLINHLDIATALSQVAFCSTALFNGVYVKLHRGPYPILEQIGDYFGIVQMTRGLFYSIYGIDRCKPEIEANVVLIDNKIDPELVPEYIAQVLLIVAGIRILTFAIMFFRFSSFPKFCRLSCSFGGSEKSKPALEEVVIQQPEAKTDKARKASVYYQVPFPKVVRFADVDTKKPQRRKSKTMEDILSMSRRVSRGEGEKKRCAFLTGKPIIAWNHLSLFRSNSIITGDTPTLSGEPEKAILRDLSGGLAFGTLNAILGASGAGKSSLLKVLNGRSKTRLGPDTEIYLSRYTTITTCFISQVSFVFL